jgi:hypothetical protein
MLPERPEAVGTLAPGPEDAYEQQESPEPVTDATHTGDSRTGRGSVKSCWDLSSATDANQLDRVFLPLKTVFAPDDRVHSLTGSVPAIASASCGRCASHTSDDRRCNASSTGAPVAVAFRIVSTATKIRQGSEARARPALR